MDFERMRVQQKSHLYENMRIPPRGTVTRESVADSAIAGAAPASLTIGQQTFGIYCAVCHGAAAFGGSLVAENMGQPRAPSLRTATALALSPRDIYEVETHGKGRMPPYAPQLTAEERWAVAAYVVRLQRSGAATPEAIADSLRAIEIQRIDSALARERRP
jgi:mono/diheme cytochrome c family protein